MHGVPAELNEVRRRLANVCGFLGVGFGLKETAGKPTSQLAWRVYVAKKIPKTRLTPGQRIPPILLGFPTDVVRRQLTFATSCVPGELPVEVSARTSGEVPVEGAMIANKKGVPGTLGCWARHALTGEAVLLTNYHVLFGKRCRAGDVIWRVRPSNQNADHQRAAHLNGGHLDDDFLKIGTSLMGKAATVKFHGASYFIDAAIGGGDGFGDKADAQAAGASCSGAGEAKLGSHVSKTGAATQRTSGTIVDVCYPDRWHFDLESAAAPNQILIQPDPNTSGGILEPFSRVGDSGAVIRDETGLVVGLLWGSNARGEGIACHIGPVVSDLGIRLGPVS